MSERTVKTVVGLEVHCQLKTQTKLFCGCRTSFGDEPNSHCCPVCLGLPGVLPVMNRAAYRLAVVTALALNCTIARHTKWDRKHYYYPDLPKNYQISQYDLPLGADGGLEIEFERDGRLQRKKIRIRRVHLEEDAGKLMHAPSVPTESGLGAASLSNREGGGNFSEVDLNRTGTPLMEIVSEPDLGSIEEVRAYSTALRQLVTYLGVSEANMQMGHMRFEPNINLEIAENGQTFKTPIVELKNLNSFRAVERAVAFEERRQLAEWHESRRQMTPGGSAKLTTGSKTTRGWDDLRGETFVQREKEEAHDYRYFPEPDLVVVEPEESWLEELRRSLPELPLAKKDRFVRELGLSEYDAGVLTATIEAAMVFEEMLKEGVAPKAAANWLTQGVARELNDRNLTFESIPRDDSAKFYSERAAPSGGKVFVPTAESLAELVKKVDEGVISSSVASQVVLPQMFETGTRPIDIIALQGLAQVSDTAELERLIDEAIAANPGPVADYKAGKKQAFGRIMGHIMKTSGGKANPKVVSALLEKRLNS
jgi:aspartyl-tRNA(Asn)/glutamyl-tRNA(Gln) amidotransferase subunit B